MKNKKRVLIASSLSCAILLLSAATTQANSAHKDSQDQNKKEHVDKSQQKDKRNVTNKDKNSGLKPLLTNAGYLYFEAKLSSGFSTVAILVFL